MFTLNGFDLFRAAMQAGAAQMTAWHEAWHGSANEILRSFAAARPARDVACDLRDGELVFTFGGDELRITREMVVARHNGAARQWSAQGWAATHRQIGNLILDMAHDSNLPFADEVSAAEACTRIVAHWFDMNTVFTRQAAGLPYRPPAPPDPV